LREKLRTFDHEPVYNTGTGFNHSDNINQMITLTAITLSGFHCSTKLAKLLAYDIFFFTELANSQLTKLALVICELSMPLLKLKFYIDSKSGGNTSIA
jgi:hypothetical protein